MQIVPFIAEHVLIRQMNYLRHTERASKNEERKVLYFLCRVLISNRITNMRPFHCTMSIKISMRRIGGQAYIRLARW